MARKTGRKSSTRKPAAVARPSKTSKRPAAGRAGKKAGTAKKATGKTVKANTKKTGAGVVRRAAGRGAAPAARRQSAGAGRKKAASHAGAGRAGGTRAAATAQPNPAPVSTGRGPAPGEVGHEFVALFNAMTPDEQIWARWFSPDLVSVEGEGMNTAWRGMDAVREKAAGFSERNILHGGSAEGPFVGSTGFAVKYRVDVEERATGNRSIMEEVAVYTVENGRIVREEFMYRR